MKGRRSFLGVSTIAGASLLLLACKKGGQKGIEKAEENSEDKSAEVTATEDLMREHGVLRRALLVYAEAVPRLRADAASVSTDALHKTATLFRAFGEEYHEKKLEEAYIFPKLKIAGGAAAALPDILVAQHDRGREITEYILSSASQGKFGANSESLAQALSGFVRMYQHHAAMEDTVVFPAWKATLTDEQYDEIGDKFEEIERQQFGEDGFETAVKQMADIEATLGVSDLSQFTAPPPPSPQSDATPKK